MTTFTVEDPATGEVIAEVADAGPADGERALVAAHQAQCGWGRTAPRKRADILYRAYTLLTERTAEFADLITREMGKPPAEAQGEVAYAAGFLRWFAEEASRISGRFGTAPDGQRRTLVTKRPVGPALLVTPWNFPLAMVTRKVGPAVAAGCTMILKPAELTPLTALATARLFDEAGLPPGVLTVLPTSRPAELVDPLLRDPRLRKLSFTGSTRVGQHLIAASAEQVLRTSMELGGNAPFLVFDDADLDAAVEGALVAKLRNGGQSCVAANRFLVHGAVADEFVARFGKAMAAATIGPLISAAAREKVARLVDSSGATIAVGGNAVPGPGYFFEPTLLTDMPADSAILQEEIFGPVAPIVTFATEPEAIELANATPFGLTAFAYTRDLGRTLRLADELETGMIGLNTGLVSDPSAPFGGAKLSGLGRQGGAEGIDEYLETRYVGIADPYGS